MRRAAGSSLTIGLALALATLAILSTDKAWAVPEMARFGYFSCTTCHVSPSGGGLQTAYGRGLSAERLSTWSYKGEEQPLHGALPELPEWLLVGGDVRYAQTYYEAATVRTGRLIRMQTDLSLGVTFSRLTVVATGGPRGESRSRPEIAGKPALRQYFAKVDIAEGLSVRGGRFYSRFGLNIPQHNANVRAGLGFDQGLENENAEVTWTTESNELALTRLFGVPSRELDGSRDRGWTANWTHYLLGRHRMGVSLMQADFQDQRRTVAGVNGVFAIGERWFVLSETDRQSKRPLVGAGAGNDELFVFNRLGFEPVQGVVPFFSAENTLHDIHQRQSEVDTYGMGMQWYPRPHLDFEALIGTILKHVDYTFGASGYLIAHYYL